MGVGEATWQVGGPGHRHRAVLVLTGELSVPCLVGGREFLSLEMDLLCLFPSGDKEEERHKRGGAADQQTEGDAAGPAGQGGADPEAAAGGKQSLPPHACATRVLGRLLLAVLGQGPADWPSGVTLLTAGQ